MDIKKYWPQEEHLRPYHFILTKDMYLIFNKKDILKYYSSWSKSLNNNKLNKYINCIEYSDFFKNFCYINGLTQIKKDPSWGFNIGILYYESSILGKHCINFICYKVKNKIKCDYFEPQNGKFIKLSQKEINSIYLIYL